MSQTNLPREAGDVTQQFTQEEKETFQWTLQWYPVAVVDFLDPSRPHAIQLLGKELVLWRDGSSQWR